MRTASCSGARRVRRDAEVEVVKRSDKARGFTLLPRRWVVERTMAWLNRRRLAEERKA